MFRLPVAKKQQDPLQSVYGIEYDKTIAAPEVTRIGNMDLHVTLPLQARMRRCLLLDNGTVNYYLNAGDSTLKADGTPAVLDGTAGQVMVEIPGHWRKFEEEGNICRVLLSENFFSGAKWVPVMYVSAYKAALDRRTNTLSSVVNGTVDFRGGNNNAANDGAANTLLGKPVTATSRIDFRTYAENRGLNSDAYGINGHWLDMDYQARKTIFWFITVEYATRNHQTAVNAALTAEGYRQGALGEGPTNLSAGDWSTFSGYYPVYDCGLTNSLGNNTGEVPVVLQDFPTAGLTYNTQSNSYRGVENFFGDIWEWTNGANIKIEGALVTAYVATGVKNSDNDYLGYKVSGIMASANGYISEVIFGQEGDILPSGSTGGSSTTYFSDYYYKGSDGLRGLRFGGDANDGSFAGSACVLTLHAPSLTYATLGSRLCFFAR